MLRIDREIRSGRYPSARGLARALEVSIRTLNRDLEYLKKNGAPLAFVPSRKGYHYVDPSYRFSATCATRTGHEITLRLAPTLAAKLLDRQPAEVETLLSSFDGRTSVREIQLRTDGGAELILSSSELDPAIHHLLALGPDAEILGPAAVLRRARAIVKQLSARYRAD